MIIADCCWENENCVSFHSNTHSKKNTRINSLQIGILLLFQLPFRTKILLCNEKQIDKQIVFVCFQSKTKKAYLRQATTSFFVELE